MRSSTDMFLCLVEVRGIFMDCPLLRTGILLNAWPFCLLKAKDQRCTMSQNLNFWNAIYDSANHIKNMSAPFAFNTGLCICLGRTLAATLERRRGAVFFRPAAKRWIIVIWKELRRFQPIDERKHRCWSLELLGWGLRRNKLAYLCLPNVEVLIVGVGLEKFLWFCDLTPNFALPW